MKNQKQGLSTGMYVLIGVGVLVLLLLLWGIGSYNGLISSDETVNEKWGNVQADYQRRADLIPNLVATVQENTKYEGDVLKEITRARSAWTDARTQAEKIDAAQQVDSTISKLLLVAENYPQLRATESFISLQDELAGTENRIKFSRTEFNAAVKTYNQNVRRFPGNIVAGMFGFDTKASFAANAGAENATNVKVAFNS